MVKEEGGVGKKNSASSSSSSSSPSPVYTSVCLLHVDLDMETWSAGCDKIVVLTPEKNAKPRRSRTHFWSYVIKDLTAGRVPLTTTTTTTTTTGRGQSAATATGVAEEGMIYKLDVHLYEVLCC